MNEFVRSELRWRGAIGVSQLAVAFVGSAGLQTASAPLAHRIALRAKRAPISAPCGSYGAVAAVGEAVALVYLDPRRFDWRSAQTLAERWRRFDPQQDRLEDLLIDLSRQAPRRIDRQLTRALEHLRAGVSPPEISASLGISESTLTRRFHDVLGAPPKRWDIWMRLRGSLDVLLEGHSVTQAAHECGFSDAAHFARTCRSLFGITPSDLRALTPLHLTNEACSI